MYGSGLIRSLSGCSELQHLRLPRICVQEASGRKGPGADSSELVYSTHNSRLHTAASDISKLTVLQNLEITFKSPDEDLQGLVERATALTSLTALRLHHASTSCTHFKELMSRLPGLHELRLERSDGWSNSSNPAVGIVASVTQSSNLQHLMLSGLKFGAVGINVLVQSLHGLPRLRGLRFDSEGLNDAAAAALAGPLKSLIHLKHLDLGRN